MGRSVCVQGIHGLVFISGRLTEIFQRTGGEAMGWRSQPPPPTSCQGNTAPKSPLPLPSLPFPLAHAHLSGPSQYLGHDCVGVVGSPASRGTWLPRKKSNKKKKSKGGQQRNYFSKDQRNSESARDITPHQPLTHTHAHSSSLAIPGPPKELYISGEAVTEPLK